MTELDTLPDVDMKAELEKQSRSKRIGRSRTRSRPTELKPKPKSSVVFLDDDEESEDDNEVIATGPQTRSVTPIIGNRPLIDYIQIDVKQYRFKNWLQCFPDKKVNLRSLIFNPAWDEFLSQVETRPYYKRMETILSRFMVEAQHEIVPPAELLFNAFNILSPARIRVVLLGQDPYPGAVKVGSVYIHHATGLSFSIPAGIPKAESLKNIYTNLHQFGHVKKAPQSGCMSALALQGCFMINTALTTFSGGRGAHRAVWKEFSNDLISYLANKYSGLVFLAWGRDAHMTCLKVDPNKHCIITSSHPSPMSADRTFEGMSYGTVKDERDRKRVTYPPFNTIDHFGRVNERLVMNKQDPILWDLLDTTI